MSMPTALGSLGLGLVLAVFPGITTESEDIPSPPVTDSEESAEEPKEFVEEPLLTRPVSATMARIERQRIPEYPASMASKGEEGWVILSYVIGTDGRVGDLIVQDSSGQRDFERAALKAAARWRFTPATVQGEPVEQCDTQSIFVFARPGPGGARKKFRDQFTLVRDQFAAGDIDAAARSLDALEEAGGWNNYETSRIRLLRFELCQKTGNLECELTNLRRAAVNGGRGLERDIYRQVLEATAKAEIRSTLYRDALQTIARRNKLRPALAPDDPLMKASAEIIALAHGTDPLAFSGTIGFRSGCDLGQANWAHPLLRRRFAVDTLEGKADRLEIRCDWRRASDIVTADKTWTVPAEWGRCVVYVFGDVGAKVRLVEYPLEENAAGNETLPAAAMMD